MKTSKYICKRCGYAEPYNLREKIGIHLITVLIVLGIFFAGYIIFIGPKTFMGQLGSAYFTRYAAMHDDEIRDITMEVTKHCDTSWSYCYAEAVYKNLSIFRYVPVSLHKTIYSPLKAYQEKAGDCKVLSTLYVAMLNSVGIRASVECSYDEMHCVAVVPNCIATSCGDTFWVVDLTKPSMEEHNRGSNIWK